MPIALRFSSLAAAAVLLAPLGCSTEVGGSEPSATTAVAMLASQMPPLPEDISFATSVDPQSVMVFVGGDVTCQAPFLSPWHQGNTCTGPDRQVFRVVLGIPPAKQTPGMISLSDPAVPSSSEEQRIDGSACAGGGNSLSGTIELVSLDASAVTLRFNGTVLPHDPDMPDVQQILGGKTIDAVRCP